MSQMCCCSARCGMPAIQLAPPLHTDIGRSHHEWVGESSRPSRTGGGIRGVRAVRSLRIKLSASVIILALVLAAMPFVGVTVAEEDATEGTVLDFGYWDLHWVEMDLIEGMTGDDVIDIVCSLMGYDEPIRLNDGSVYSVNGQENLIGVSWGFYVLGEDGWEEADPSTDVGQYQIVSWARSSGVSGLVPGTDYTGFSYYGYAEDGTDTVTGEPLRVISLAPSVTETIVAVGGLDLIVGTDLYSNYPQEVVDRQSDGTITYIGGYIDPNYEWILKLDPDLVICDGSVGQHVTVADKLRKAGVDVLVLYDAVDISTMYDNIWLTASALGMSENANQVISDLGDTIDIVSGIAGDTNKRVFLALSSDPSPWTSGSYTFASDLVANAGGRNVFDSQSSGWFMVNKEQIYAKQPQVIIIISATPVEGQEDYDAILDSLDPMWKNTPAYQNGEIYVFSGAAADMLQRPGPRLAEAAELIAKILNPDSFLDRDPLDAIPKWFGDDYQDYLRYQVGDVL